jgi:recombination protein RecA
MQTNTISSFEITTLISRLGLHQGPQPALTPDAERSRWDLGALSGRLAELSSDGACALMSATVPLILQAQRRGEPVAWVSAGPSTFHPPDMAQSGVDLAALPIVRVRDGREAVRAADKLLRSGAFAVVVLDLGRDHHIPIPVQSRLAGLSNKHHSLLLFLTKKKRDDPSIGSLVSLRAETRARRASVTGTVTFDRFTWEIRAIKDKRDGPGWTHEEICRGPEGLC